MRTGQPIHEREGLLDAILKTTLDGFLMIDTGGRILDVNDAYCELSGYGRQELVGMSMGSLDANESPADLSAHIQRVIASGSQRFESRHRRKDGSVYPVEVSTMYLQEQGGRFVSFCRDLTERKATETTLRQHSHLLQHTPNAVYVSDEQGRIIYANIAASRQTGFAPSDIIGKHVWDIDASFPKGEYASLVSGMAADGVCLRSRHRRVDGSEFPVEMSLSKLEHEGSTLLCGIARDMSEQDAREASLRRTQFSVDRAPTSVFWMSPDGRFVYVNDKAAECLGYTRDELLKLRIEDVDSEFRRHSIASQCASVQAGEGQFESVHRRKDGTVFPVSVHICHLQFMGEEMDVAQVEDITERKRTESRLRIMAEMLNCAPSAITVHDQNGRFLYANEKTFALHGYSASEFMAINLHELDVPESRAKLEERFRRIATEGEARFEVGHFCKDGSSFPLEVLARTIQWEGEQVVLSIAADITERKRAEAELREAAVKLQEAVRAADVGLWDWELATNRVRFSPEWKRQIGYAEHEIGDGFVEWESRVHPDDLGPTLAYVRQMISERRQSYSVEFRFRHRDTSFRWILAQASVILGDQGDPVRVVGSHIDITERKRAEESLQETEQRYRTLIEHFPNGAVFLFDRDVRYKLCGGSALRRVGWSSVDLVGRTLWEVFPPALSDVAGPVCRAVFEGHAGEYTVDYGNRVYQSWAVPIRGGDGTVVEGAVFSLDVTERLRAEADLRHSEEQVRRKLQAVLDPEEDLGLLSLEDIVETKTIQSLMESLYDLTKVGFGLIDQEGKVLAATGWQDVCVRFHRVHPETRRFCEESDTLLTEGVAPGTTHEYHCKNHMWDICTPIVIGGRRLGNLFLGQFFYDDEEPDYQLFRTRARRFGFDEDAYLDAIGRVPRWSRQTVERVMKFYSSFAAFVSTLSYANLKLARTLEERKRVEEERERLREQLNQSQKMESVGRLAGGVAHDFNNMLSVILGHVELAMAQPDLTERVRADLQQIREAAERSADLTRQLLAFARKQTVTPKVIDPNLAVEGMLKMLRRLIGEDIDLRWLPASAPWLVKMDPSQLNQILANLCVNARDAISGPGRVTIETRTATLTADDCPADCAVGDYVLLAVSDTGCGMEPEVLDNLFEPFYSTKETGKGTGLGLATVYGVVKQNHGFIQVFSEPSRGTTFKVHLPRYAGPAEPAPSRETSTPRVSRGKETILLVEDESAILDLISQTLKAQGYTVLAASSPHQALRLAEQHADGIHLLLTDVVMPEMNGRDLAQRLLGMHPDLKAIFVSGYTADVIAHHGLLNEGVHFVQKPFSMRELVTRVRAVLDQGPGAILPESMEPAPR